MMAAPQTDTTRMKCPSCSRFIGAVQGTKLDAVPCPCGWQTVVTAVGKRAREIEASGEQPLEFKSS